MKTIIKLFSTCLITTFANAQSPVITGKIVDSASGKMLPLTTITIFKAKDTSIVTYRLTNENGEFKIPGLPFNVALRLMASYSGFTVYRKEFTLTEIESSINLGVIKMTGTSKQLDEVMVMSERPPVVIKRDTIEFNASAFKTLPTALLEDLLKKLPGVNVDENGDITVNGQKVNRLLVDGKRFFGNDPKMATRNLPSNLIDKIQVVDDQEQIALNNDGDLSRIGKVLNITLKKEVKKAVFGRVFAGGGTEERYEVGGILNSFRDTLQISLLAFSNNVNRSSFSIKDATQLGGFERSGWGNINGNGNTGGQQGFSIDGFSFGGTGTGVNKATGTGININHSPSKRFNFYLQYLYGRTKNIAIQQQNTDRFFHDTVITTNSLVQSTLYGITHSSGVGGSWNPDSLTVINGRFSFSQTSNDGNAPTSISTVDNKSGSLNYGNGILFSNMKNTVYNHNLSLTHRSGSKKGRIFSLNHILSYNENPVSITTETENHYLYPSIANIILQQLRTTNAPATNFHLNASYSEPLSSKLTFRLNGGYTYNKNVQDIATLSKHTGGKNYDSLILGLSSNMAREQSRWTNNAVFSYRIKAFTVNAGVNWLQQWVNNSYSSAATSNKQHYSDLLYNLSVNWQRFSIGLSQDVIPPAINYLIPIPDNSSPFLILNGNPELQPTKRSVINLNGNLFNTKKNISYFFNAQSAMFQNAIIQSVVMATNGIQVNTPVNVNGAVYNYASVGFNRQFKNNQSFNLTINANLSANLNRVPFLYNNERSSVTSFSSGINTGLLFNWHDVVEFTPKYMPSINKVYYSSSSFVNKDFASHTLQGELIVRFPKKIVWETNILYRNVGDGTSGLPRSSTYWNAAVTILMLKNDRGQLRLGVYDILNKNGLINQSFSTNAIIYSQTNVLPRYFLLTYSYNIRTFGNQKSKVGGLSGMFRL